MPQRESNPEPESPICRGYLPAKKSPEITNMLQIFLVIPTVEKQQKLKIIQEKVQNWNTGTIKLNQFKTPKATSSKITKRSKNSLPTVSSITSSQIRKVGTSRIDSAIDEMFEIDGPHLDSVSGQSDFFPIRRIDGFSSDSEFSQPLEGEIPMDNDSEFTQPLPGEICSKPTVERVSLLARQLAENSDDSEMTSISEISTISRKLDYNN